MPLRVPKKPFVLFCLPLFIGLLSCITPLGLWFANVSYDLIFLTKPSQAPDDLIIVYMDEKSFLELGQSPQSWDRRLHAGLLNHLNRERAKLVVFDVLLVDPGDRDANAQLEKAMKESGRVVLASAISPDNRPGAISRSLKSPLSQFKEAVGDGHCGIAYLQSPSATIRQHAKNLEIGDSLPWTAAKALGAFANDKNNLPQERWVNYYGAHGALRGISYCEATNQPPGFFRDKIVFIGGRPKTLYAFAEAEEYRTPYSLWGKGSSPGVEIMATMFLNLYRGDWIRRLPVGLELLLLVLSMALLAYAYNCIPPKFRFGFSLICGIMCFFLAIFPIGHIWLPWALIIALSQVFPRPLLLQKAKLGEVANLIPIFGCKSEDSALDVIFVHGLNGDARSTWHPKNETNKFWPLWLGKEVGQARVWSLSYPVSASAWQGITMPLSDRAFNILHELQLRGIGSRPLVFICHSLGGLLVKQMLRHATTPYQKEWELIAQNTRGLVFLSTPHAGSDLANWIKYLGIVLRTTVSVEELEANNSRLRELNFWFRKFPENRKLEMQIYCEKKKINGILVVDETSADPGIVNCIPIPLDEDHVSICKASKDSTVYRGSVALIKKVLDETRQLKT